jgi:S1-C subfamily serine protease
MPSRPALAALVFLSIAAPAVTQTVQPEQGFLGVKLRLKDLADGSTRVAVWEIVMASPAEKAGLKVGDVVNKVANVEAKDVEGVVETIKMFKPGDRITIEITREDKDLTITAVLTKRPKDL